MPAVGELPKVNLLALWSNLVQEIGATNLAWLTFRQVIEHNNRLVFTVLGSGSWFNPPNRENVLSFRVELVRR
jgi:hypothetical protein